MCDGVQCSKVFESLPIFDLVAVKSIVRIMPSLVVSIIFFQRVRSHVLMLVFHCAALRFIELLYLNSTALGFHHKSP